MLKDTTNKDFHPPARLVDMLYDMDNLPGAAKRQRAFIAANVKLFHSVNVAALAANVRVPVLLQWCALDTVIAQSEAQSVADFKNTKVDLITYKDLGHFPMWEDPDRFTGDLKTFLDRVTAQTPTAPAQAVH
jgi:pimeloyl-ACP methyl ester carboxylesterase